MSEKLTHRLLLRVDEETAVEVRNFAATTERTLMGSLRYLLRQGLSHERLATAGNKRLLAATGGNREEKAG